MSKQGPPKHQNKYAWKPNAGRKINETEPGGKLRPLPDLTEVCRRCKDQIEWKRKYGKYKPLTEPAKWDSAEVEAEQKLLEAAIKNARERDRRTLLRAMNKDKPKGHQVKTQTIQEGKVRGLFSATSLEEYAELSRDNDDDAMPKTISRPLTEILIFLFMPRAFEKISLKCHSLLTGG